MKQIIECVPNFSEGRDQKIIDQILKSITGVSGITVLGCESDYDHHRSVITFIGTPTAVVEAAFQMAKTASSLIDISKHQGVHPRLGALDVLPLIPLKNISFEETVILAKTLGQRLGKELQIPIYLYEKAASTPKNINLAHVRKNFSSTIEPGTITKPDFGPRKTHPSAGAICLGVRKILVAFNVNLATTNLSIAKKIAKSIRESSGGLKAVKAIGLALKQKDCTQVSMNLVDYKVTGIKQVFQAIQKQAAIHKVEILESELIGFMPKGALEGATPQEFKLPKSTKDRILENYIFSLD